VGEMVLLSILGALLIGLLALVFLAEKFGKQHSPESLSKMTRWLFPLMFVLLLLQGLRYIL
jgi:cadmium resistance protein CadD (predicted permease)